MKATTILLFATIVILSSIANRAEAKTNPPCPTDRPDYFCISPDMAPESQIDVVKFYTIPVQILQLFTEEKLQIKYPVILNADWESPFFGAGVSQFEDQFQLMILGGTSRIAGLTTDAYAAIVCHELGHIIGGAPYQTLPFAEWSSAEGQADFFAASLCLPRYFRSMNQPENKISARVEEAGYEMIRAFYTVVKDSADGKNETRPVRFKADTSKVPTTLINNYPSLQCRYENFRNPTARPGCWYKSE